MSDKHKNSYIKTKKRSAPNKPAYYFEKELHNKIILNSPIEHINYEQDIIKVISGSEKYEANAVIVTASLGCLLYTSPSPRD